MFWAACLTLAATLPTASEAPLRVAVLTEIPADTGWTTSRINRAVADVASEWVGIDIVTQETLFAGGQSTPVRNCGADVLCLGRELRYVGIDYVVLMVASRLEPELRLLLRLVDVAQAINVASRPGSWDPAKPGDLRRRLREIFGDLPRPRAAWIELSSVPVDAELAVRDDAGRVVGRGPGSHRLRPAPYRIDANRAGYLARRTRLDLVPGARVQHRIELEPVESDWYASPWFWGAVAGVLVVGASVGIAVAASSGDQCLCFGSDPDACPPPC